MMESVMSQARTEYMISYAQNFEDVMLARLFSPDYKGFYVDIGAADPDYLSVTRYFYDRGWRGINVEPSRLFFPRLQERRPDDLNLWCGIGNAPGRATFHQFSLAENSTLDQAVAEQLTKEDPDAEVYEVDVITLADLCDRFVKDRVMDFMKIDVEGGERAVLEGADWRKYRPRVLIVEATRVNDPTENWQEWEPILIAADYQKVWFDALNNFYLRAEDLHLREHFRLPPNLFDLFIPSYAQDHQVRNYALEAAHKADQVELQRLNVLCAEQEAEIARLTQRIRGSRSA
jgi:FkbM family methyltransferase